MSSDRPGRPADVVPGDEGSDVPEPSGGSPVPEDGDRPADPATDPDLGVIEGGRARRRRAKDRKKGSLLKELPVLLVIALALALLVKTFFIQAFFIPSGSMEQTLHGCPGCTGDRVLVDKVPYWFHDPQPGDIVVFKGPDTWAPEVSTVQPTNWFSGALLWLGRAIGVAPPSEDDFVKRVIATGGQTVQCCDAQGRVMVDGKSLDEPYIFENSPLVAGPGGREFGPVTVPQGRLWVMGDHRSDSADSRVHVDDRYHGTISVDDVIGKAQVIVWPLGRFGILHAPDIQGAAADTGLPYATRPAPSVPVVVRRRRTAT